MLPLPGLLLPLAPMREPRSLPPSGAYKSGRSKRHSFHPDDIRAKQRRVSRRRAKKSYA